MLQKAGTDRAHRALMRAGELLKSPAGVERSEKLPILILGSRLARLGGHRRAAALEALDALQGRFLRGKALVEINRDMIERIIAAKSAEGSSPGTVNRIVQLVRAVLRRAAYEWEWLDKAPRVRLLREPKRRVRYLTRDEAERLLAELPSHLAAMARFSLETGLRQANVSGCSGRRLI